jgi:hypothetical protein
VAHVPNPQASLIKTFPGIHPVTSSIGWNRGFRSMRVINSVVSVPVQQPWGSIMDFIPTVSWGTAAVALPLTLILYLSSLCIYRLFLHPLAKLPGPKLAALSNYYEFYHDVVQQGQFTFHIQDLHRRYGWVYSHLVSKLICNRSNNQNYAIRAAHQ